MRTSQINPQIAIDALMGYLLYLQGLTIANYVTLYKPSLS